MHWEYLGNLVSGGEGLSEDPSAGPAICASAGVTSTSVTSAISHLEWGRSASRRRSAPMTTDSARSLRGSLRASLAILEEWIDGSNRLVIKDFSPIRSGLRQWICLRKSDVC